MKKTNVKDSVATEKRADSNFHYAFCICCSAPCDSIMSLSVNKCVSAFYTLGWRGDSVSGLSKIILTSKTTCCKAERQKKYFNNTLYFYVRF